MRPAHAAIAAAGLLVMALAISAGGHPLAASEAAIEIDAPEDLPPDPDALPPEDDAAGPEAPEAKAKAGVGALERWWARWTRRASFGRCISRWVQ